MLVPRLLPDGATVTETEACAHLRPMIEKLAARFARFAPRYSLYEDLVQEGNLGAILAFRSWRADGGASSEKGGGAIPVIVAGGEFIVSPEDVKQIGKGDISAGHKILDHFVKLKRQEAIKTLKTLPGPAKK